MVTSMTTKLNVFEEACRNEFDRMESGFNTSIKALRNEMIQCYAIARSILIN
jgi:hypothetical protein